MATDPIQPGAIREDAQDFLGYTSVSMSLAFAPRECWQKAEDRQLWGSLRPFVGHAY